jgi:glutathione-regulated potassium-efflux system ancillary protein KefC
LQAAQGRVIEGTLGGAAGGGDRAVDAATPLLLAAADRWWAPRAAARQARAGAPPPTIETPQEAPVIIAGFGRYGQIVGRLLAANGLDATVLDHDPEQIETVRRFGWSAFYGDATRLDLLRMAGAGQARVFVLAIDDVEQSVAVAPWCASTSRSCRSWRGRATSRTGAGWTSSAWRSSNARRSKRR